MSLRRAATRRATASRTGDTVLLLDCEEVRRAGSQYVGAVATIVSVNRNGYGSCLIEVKDGPHPSRISVSQSCFLGATTSLYGNPDIPQPPLQSRLDVATSADEHHETTTNPASKKASSARTKRTKKTMKQERPKSAKAASKPKRDISMSSSALGRPPKLPKDRPGLVAKFKAGSASAFGSHNQLDKVAKARRTTPRKRVSDQEFQRAVAMRSAFIDARRRDFIKAGHRSRARYLGMSDAQDLPQEICGLIQDQASPVKISNGTPQEAELVRTMLEERSPLDLLGNSIKLFQGTGKWKRGCLTSHSEKDGHYLVRWYVDDEESDSEQDAVNGTSDLSSIDLSATRCIEYVDVVWAKMNGWPEWPAQVIVEYNPSAETPTSKVEPGEFVVEFFGTHDCARILESKVWPFRSNIEEFSKAKRMRRKLLDALDEAKAVDRRRRHRRRTLQSIGEVPDMDFGYGNGDRLTELQKLLRPQQWIGKRIRVWWPLDNAWYYGAVRRYDPDSQKHLVVYDDTVEWVDLKTEKVSLRLEGGDEGGMPVVLESTGSDSDSAEDLLNSKKQMEITADLSSTISEDDGCCFLCVGSSSASDSELVISCSSCTRQCHSRCFDPVGNRKASSSSVLRCPACLRCCMCDDVRDFGDKIACEVCGERAHPGCLNPPLSGDLDEGYICTECALCRGCGTSSDVFEAGNTLCEQCSVKYDRGEFCPECECVFGVVGSMNGDDSASAEQDKRVRCRRCNRWVHRACISGSWCQYCERLEACLRLRPILDRLIAEDKHGHFIEPVSELFAPNYSAVVKTPMDLAKIRSKLDLAEYEDAASFRDDINLIWKNAFAYNPPTSMVFKDAVRLQDFASTAFQKIEGTRASSSSSAKRKHASQSTAGSRDESSVDVDSCRFVGSWVDYESAVVSGRAIRSVDLCLACLSAGAPEDMLCCADCGECLHVYCLGDGVTANIERHQLWRWRCPDCTVCDHCGRADRVDELLQCDLCDAGIHLDCHDPALPRVPEDGFRCAKCRSCRGCGTISAANWKDGFTSCGPCSVLYKQNKFCPVCDRVWRASDRKPMVCCDSCDMWVHNSCDGITDAQYQALTDESERYFCPKCRPQASAKDGPSVRTADQEHATSNRARPGDAKEVPGQSAPEVSDQEIEPENVLADIRGRSSADMSVPEMYNSMAEMVLLVQQKRRRSRRRLLIDTARHLGKGNKHVKMLPRKASFKLVPVEAQLNSSEAVGGVAPAVDLEAKEEHTPKEEIKNASPEPSVPSAETAADIKSPVLTESQSSSRRRCRLCHVIGDASETEQGRLLLAPHSIWVHAQCSIWSAEVFERELGYLTNMNVAMLRSKTTRCAWCSELGATLNCCLRSCDRSFHFGCAKSTKCVFLSDCRTFCNLHAPQPNSALSKEILDVLETERIRRKLVIRHRPSSKDKAPVDDDESVWAGDGTACLRLGSLSVERLGSVEHMSPHFHSRWFIYPVGYRSHRIFWSFQNPGKRALYTCSVERSSQDSDKPCFRISCTDVINQGGVHMIEAGSATEAWRSLVGRIDTFITRNCKRRVNAAGDTLAFGLSGPVFFGFGHPEIRARIARLPNASLCATYGSDSSVISPSRKRARSCRDSGAHTLGNIDDPDDENGPGDAHPPNSGSSSQPSRRGARGRGRSQASGGRGRRGRGRGRGRGHNSSSAAPVEGLVRSAAAQSVPLPEWRDREGSSLPATGLAALVAVCPPGHSQISVVAPGTKLPLLASGCIRTEGLASVRRQQQALSQRRSPSILEQSGHEGRSANLSSGSDTEKMNQVVAIPTLYRRMKSQRPPFAARSSIDGIGLFSSLPYQAHDMVIEFVGEVIRSKVADRREQMYASRGIGGCFMFRIDDELVIDATERGSVARYINHSCDRR